MLILTGVVVEITDGKPRHMLLFSSPRVPGAHYKVQADGGTALRIQALIAAETTKVSIAEQVAQQLYKDDEEAPQRDPFGRN